MTPEGTNKKLYEYQQDGYNPQYTPKTYEADGYRIEEPRIYYCGSDAYFAGYLQNVVIDFAKRQVRGGVYRRPDSLHFEFYHPKKDRPTDYIYISFCDRDRDYIRIESAGSVVTL